MVWDCIGDPHFAVAPGWVSAWRCWQDAALIPFTCFREMAGFFTNPSGKEFHHSQQSDTCFLRLDQMRVSCIPKPSQTESLHWVTCLLIAQPETSWTRMYLLELITPQQDQSVQDTWWASRQPVHQREQYHLRAFHPPVHVSSFICSSPCLCGVADDSSENSATLVPL